MLNLSTDVRAIDSKTWILSDRTTWCVKHKNRADLHARLDITAARWVDADIDLNSRSKDRLACLSAWNKITTLTAAHQTGREKIPHIASRTTEQPLECPHFSTSITSTTKTFKGCKRTKHQVLKPVCLTSIRACLLYRVPCSWKPVWRVYWDSTNVPANQKLWAKRG